uniref:ZP domain-containing protein n=1 Tax=Plectus sambesii TaxID=2011161 RepID=A0A914X112_9BILA
MVWTTLTSQWWLLLLACVIVSSTPIDNGLIGDPSIICGSDRMIVLFATRNPFRGNVYSKGHFAQSECKVPPGPTESTNVSITIPVEGDCGLRRRRTVNPSGIVLEATVVIMFHPL